MHFNDIAGLQESFRNHGDQIAGVLLEPVPGNMGLVLPDREFLLTLRKLTEKHGALLVFDEVMTGFRVAFGGAQEVLGITPDMTILGKIIGGGLPVGAYGGRRDIMAKVSPSGPIFQAGTLSGNPLAMAAGIAMLRELKERPPYAALENHSSRLCQGLVDAASQAGLPHRLHRLGSMFTLFFTDQEVKDYASAKSCDTRRFAGFFWELMDRGVYWPCSQFEAAFLSTAHTDTEIEHTIDVARKTCKAIA